MRLPILTIDDVCSQQLCTGCGVCAAMEPQRFRMGDDVNLGRRPFLVNDPAEETGAGLACCPGNVLKHDFVLAGSEILNELVSGWGPVLEVWEGHATDAEIRNSGSSGGAASALSLFAVEDGGFDAVIHTAARKDIPYLNHTVLSRSREAILTSSGSRYSPASPCDVLGDIAAGEDHCLFVGKPCDVAAVSKAVRLNSSLNSRIGCTIAFFCAGTPSTYGTLELMKKVGVRNPATVKNLRYRGNGWPGMWTVTFHDGSEISKELTYAESWGFLQRYRQWRCYICPDHTGEFADIAVGDPWYREVEPGESGSSLIVVRTSRGRDFLEAAVASGHITLTGKDASLLPRSQPNLLATRGGLWMRLKVLSMMGVAVPKYIGFPMFRYWLKFLSLREKASSVTGTFKRVFRKNLRKRVSLCEWSPGAQTGDDA